MIEVPQQFQPTINVVYPQENTIIFEEWLSMHNIKLDREYLPIHWTSYFVNNGYGQNKQSLLELQHYIDSLPQNKKYWTVCQYDDGILVDVSRLDLLQFNMSKNIGVPIPLLCMPHTYNRMMRKNILASFIGNRTHQIRESIFNIRNGDYYISDRSHSIFEFCEVLSQSIFCLSPRGYGLSSFRMYEGMQYNCIPVYISDEFVIPYNMNFEEFGVLIEAKDAHRIEEILSSILPQEIVIKQDNIKKLYDSHFTYEGLKNQIIQVLKNEN
jgi:Exostosin family